MNQAFYHFFFVVGRDDDGDFPLRVFNSTSIRTFTRRTKKAYDSVVKNYENMINTEKVTRMKRLNGSKDFSAFSSRFKPKFSHACLPNQDLAFGVKR
jgi:hypothetical protein